VESRGYGAAYRCRRRVLGLSLGHCLLLNIGWGAMSIRNQTVLGSQMSWNCFDRPENLTTLDRVIRTFVGIRSSRGRQREPEQAAIRLIFNTHLPAHLLDDLAHDRQTQAMPGGAHGRQLWVGLKELRF
jgi:hypothetical protein